MTTSDFTQELHFITATVVDWIDVFTRPDYKRTIYWNPEVTTDENGYASVSFYNNGYSRALTISAEGLTPDGVPIINQ